MPSCRPDRRSQRLRRPNHQTMKRCPQFLSVSESFPASYSRRTASSPRHPSVNTYSSVRWLKMFCPATYIQESISACLPMRRSVVIFVPYGNNYSSGPFHLLSGTQRTHSTRLNMSHHCLATFSACFRTICISWRRTHFL